MSIQSSSFNALTTQRTFANPTIDSGILAGGVFDGRGHDFLHPNDILGSVDDFSQGISPVDSNNLMVQLVGSNPIAQNSNSSSVLSSTNGSLNNIFSANFGSGILTPSASLVSDLENFNPLAWENPNSLNVQLGIMDATNKIFGGNGLFTPNLVPPLYPYISTSIPFNNYVAPVAQQAQMFPQTFLTGSPLFQQVGTTGTTSNASVLAIQLQTRIQILQQDITALQTQREAVLKLDQTGEEDKASVQRQAAQLQSQITAKQSQLQQYQQALLQLQAQSANTGSLISPYSISSLYGQSYGQPYVISSNTTIMPYQSQVALMAQLSNTSVAGFTGATSGQSIVSGTVNGMPVRQLTQPNGVPAWLG